MEQAGFEREAFERRISETSDRQTLEALSSELALRTESWASTLRLKIGFKLAGIRRADKGEQLSPQQQSGFEKLLSRYDLSSPDGRHLYQYQISTEVFDQLHADLKAYAENYYLDAKFVPGLFVLWAADWFRRCHVGGLRKWNDIEDALGTRLEQYIWRDLTDRGLKLWGLRPLLINGTRHRLLTLAREGGFPVAALEGETSWAFRLLKNTVGELLSLQEADSEIATQIARSNCECAPPSWQDDEFLALCADLALSIVELRQLADAPAATAGLPVSVWLDANWPEWRSTLPITTDSEVGRRLVDGLMKAEPIKLRAGTIKADRLLRRENGEWHSMLRLDLDGLIEGEAVKDLDPQLGRLRCFASGQLARYISGELALLEPPDEGETRWLMRPLRRERPFAAVPWEVAVELELRADGRPVKRITLPRGAPVRSQLLAFVAVAEDDDGPIELSALGGGSGSYKAPQIYLHAPCDWNVEAEAEHETISAAGVGLPQHLLWRVDGGAIVIAPSGDKYRIVTGQTADRRDRLILIGDAPAHLNPCDPKLELFRGSPIVRVSEGTHERASRNDELFIRPPEGVWAPAQLPLRPGLYDLGWKHRQTGHLRDRRRIGILPSNFAIAIRTGRRVELSVSGWSGLKILGAQEAQPGTWFLPVSANASRFVTCELEWEGKIRTQALLPIPHQAGFARWEGGFLPPKSVFTPADARGIVACADTPTVLIGQLRDRSKRRIAGAELRWLVNDELPVSAIIGDIASLLLPCGDIDADVELGFNDGIEDYWYVRVFDGRLEIENKGVVSSRGVIDSNARLVGRALSKPNEETDLGTYSLEEALNHRPLGLPSQMYGPWMIYLRSDTDVLTRPILLNGRPLSVPQTDQLARTMCVLDFHEREAAFDRLAESVTAGGEEAYEILRSIIGLASSLRGLPPGSFEGLSLISRYPELAARLAFFATENEKADVLRLSDGLPFAWYTIPKSCWDKAASAFFEFYMPKLEPIYGTAAITEVAKMAATSARSITDIQPLLAQPLGLAASTGAILDAAQGFIRRSADKVTDFNSDAVFRAIMPEDLPSCFSRFEERYLGALDTPCAAALAALGRFTPDASQLRRIKAVERGNPLYFAEAYSAWYQEKARG